MQLHRRNRNKKLKELPLGKMLPNLATLSAMFIGLLQIKFSLQEQWEFSLLALLGAALLDATDGRLARMLNACSRFGAELDSLSDLVVFGVCPAVSLYLFSLYNIDRVGWGFCTFFAICMALRLARFNVHTIENISTVLSRHGFSVGVPAPAGAVLHLFPIILFCAFGKPIFQNPYICIGVSLAASLLCISKLPTVTIKKLHIKKEQYMPFLLGIIVSACLVFVYTWKACAVIVTLYVLSFPLSFSKAKALVMKEENGQVSPSK